jgi:hypothetical protein
MSFQLWWCCALLAWVLVEIDLRMWRRPERLDSSWGWTWPAPTRELRAIGPELPALPEVAVAGPGWVRWTDSTVEWLEGAGAPDEGMVPMLDYKGDPYWYAEEFLPPVTVDPAHVGATEDWSPAADSAAAERGMLPLDDVDEWLAARLREYDGALARIDVRPCVTLIRGDAFRTVDEEFERFVDGSQRLHAYREWRIGSTDGFSPREHMELEALCNA